MSVKLSKIFAVILVLILCLNISPAVHAEFVAEVVTPATADEKSVNVSYVSNDVVIYGQSVTLHAAAKGLDAKKCKYAFFYKYQNDNWTTIEPYSEKTSVEWTPDKMGWYQVCIKISCNLKVYKKYFNIVACKELLNHSLVSSSHIKAGDSVTMSAKASGGMDIYTYAYYIKHDDTDQWTVLNDYKEADSMQWKPSECGEYDICIKVKDFVGQVTPKYFSLTVSDEKVKTPSAFSLTVKAPVSAPYQWSCQISDSKAVKLFEKTSSNHFDLTEPSLLLTYHFQTAAYGTADITMNYTAYDGKIYRLLYHVSVDKNLNCTIEKAQGNYFEKELPEMQIITQSFAVIVDKAEDGYRWKGDSSYPNVAEFVGFDNGYDTETLTFRALRQGFTTIILSCLSPSDTNVRYQLIYNISIDENLDITVDDLDGNYIPDRYFPELKITY